MDSFRTNTVNAVDPAWFCLRCQQKHEHIAAANLSQVDHVAVFHPRFRVQKPTRRGPVWFTESLFPGYIFARFVLSAQLDRVSYTSGVNCVVHFGRHYPVVPDSLVDELRSEFGDTTVPVTELLREGETVTITDHAFRGLQAVVLRVLPARQRVEVLLEMLGQATAVELSLSAVVPEGKSLSNLVAQAVSVRG